VVALNVSAVKHLLIALRVKRAEITRIFNSLTEQIDASGAVSNYRTHGEVVGFAVFEVDGKCFVAHVNLGLQ